MQSPRLNWSITDHSEFITITNTNFAIATRNSTLGGSWSSARSGALLPPGSSYVEFKILEIGDGLGKVGIGIANGAAAINTYIGADNNGCSYQFGGNTIKGGSFTGVTPPSFTTGDVLGMSVDLDARTLKFSKNGGALSPTIDITTLGPDVFVTCSLGDGGTFSSVQLSPPIYGAAMPGSNYSIVAHGDSMSLTGAVKKTYLPRLAELLGARCAQWTRCGINGASWAFAWASAGYAWTLTEDALLRVDSAMGPSVAGAPRNVLIVFAGTNGVILGGHSAATEYANFKTYIAARIAAGWRGKDIIVCTMLPRTGLSEPTRTTYNASLVGDDGAYGYKLARLDLNASIGAAGQNLNTTWFLDGTHPTDAGHAVIAQILYDVVMTL